MANSASGLASEEQRGSVRHPCPVAEAGWAGSPLTSLPTEPSLNVFPGDSEIAHSDDEPAQGARSQELWTREVDRLFAAAVNELRRQTEERLAAVERRRTAELTELSGAITQQHEIIDSLRKEVVATRQAAARSLAEARRDWELAEFHRMKAAQDAWEKEREDLTREANNYRAVAEHLADQISALKASQKSTERQYFERLKEITAEVDRCLLRARAEWVNEVSRMSGDADWEVPTFLKGT